MLMRRLAFSSLFIVGCAAGVEDGGFATFGMPNTTTPTSGGSSQSGTETGDDTSTSGADASASGDEESTTPDPSAESSGNPTTTTDPTDPTDPSTTGEDATADDATTGMSGGMEIDLQNHDGSCEQVVWCTNNDTMEGVGAHAYAECFTNVGLAPPFDVTEVRYRVGALQIAPTVVNLQVLSWTGTAPGAVIGTQALGAADVTIGQHTVTLNNPISVNASSFCVAVTGNNAFGISLDESNSVPNVGFVKADDCGLVSYNTMASVGFPGNLCMSTTIAN